jgi:hypothetical protein
VDVELDELVERLTPPEFYVWGWLCSLNRHDSQLLELPSKPQFYSRKQLLRILKSLEGKQMLTVISAAVNQSGGLRLAMMKGCRLDTHVRAPGHPCPGEGEFDQAEAAARTPMAGRENDNGGGKRLRLDTHDQATAQLSLAKDRNKDIKALVALGQRDLIRRIANLEPGETEELMMRVGLIAPLATKRSLSQRAVIYAGLRYLQERRQIRNPRAWVEGVAQRADQEMRGGEAAPGPRSAVPEQSRKCSGSGAL